MQNQGINRGIHRIEHPAQPGYGQHEPLVTHGMNGSASHKTRLVETFKQWNPGLQRSLSESTGPATFPGGAFGNQTLAGKKACRKDRLQSLPGSDPAVRKEIS